MNTVLNDWARHFMWERILPTSVLSLVDGTLTLVKTREAYSKHHNSLPSDYNPNEEDYEKAKQHMTTINIPSINAALDCVYSPITISTITECTAQEQGKTTMCYECDDDFSTFNKERSQASHLSYRSESIFQTKRLDLLRKFGLKNDDAPSTVEEALKRISDGMFFVEEDKLDKRCGYYWQESIQWRDPSIKKDQKGFDKAEEILTEVYRTVTDEIKSYDYDRGLKAIEKFEKTKFH